MHQVILPQNLLDRHGRRVLTDEGQPGRDGVAGVGSTTEQAVGRIAAAIYANAAELDNAQLDEIAGWINLYRTSR